MFSWELTLLFLFYLSIFIIETRPEPLSYVHTVHNILFKNKFWQHTPQFGADEYRYVTNGMVDNGVSQNGAFQNIKVLQNGTWFKTVRCWTVLLQNGTCDKTVHCYKMIRYNSTVS